MFETLRSHEDCIIYIYCYFQWQLNWQHFAFPWFPLKTFKVPPILEDARDFLTGITGIKVHPEDALLVSLDFVKLYLHISHEEGTEIMKEFLNQKEVKDILSKSLCD